MDRLGVIISLERKIGDSGLGEYGDGDGDADPSRI